MEMREIKFRVWDDSICEYWDWHKIKENLNLYNNGLFGTIINSEEELKLFVKDYMDNSTEKRMNGFNFTNNPFATLFK